jgi:pantoate kinase
MSSSPENGAGGKPALRALACTGLDEAADVGEVPLGCRFGGSGDIALVPVAVVAAGLAGAVLVPEIVQVSNHAGHLVQQVGVALGDVLAVQALQAAQLRWGEVRLRDEGDAAAVPAGHEAVKVLRLGMVDDHQDCVPDLACLEILD